METTLFINPSDKTLICSYQNRETVVYIYNGIYLAILKKEILLFVTTWMNLEGIMLNFEIMQTQKDKYSTNFIYMWNIKQLNLQKQRVAW